MIFFSKQAEMWRDGEAYRKKKNITGTTKHKTGIYSMDSNGSETAMLNSNKQNDNVTRISHKVDTMKINDLEDANCNTTTLERKPIQLTQGDKLNKIKAQRRLTRSVLVGSIMYEFELFFVDFF